ncbi:hypothetical protein [Alicyclobacillus acidocaldarius]|uniref:hypothetical protein n=1 Tax=Alicyclobacillus acidocaldarius TaxID=405212 RepID=UPI0018726191|nr:hypothetical protein [Alicyclobacillus acidocaldarius]
MKRSAFLLTGVGLALAAGVLFAAGYRLTTATVPVIAANTYIPADTPVEPNELTTIAVPRRFAKQAGLLNISPSQLAGHYLSVSTVPDEPISVNMVANTNDLQALLNQYVSIHHTQGVVMNFTANSALANLVEPGQMIALTVTPQGQNATPQLYPVYVLSVLEPQTSNNSTFGGNSSSSKVLYLFVPMSEYPVVASAVLAGNAQVVLYPTGMTLPSTTNSASSVAPNAPQSMPATNATSATNGPNVTVTSNPTAPVAPPSTTKSPTRQSSSRQHSVHAK